MSSALLERIRLAAPEFLALSHEEYLQLRAYLSVPPRQVVLNSRLHKESRRGESTYARQLQEERDFHAHLRRVLAYNEGLRGNRTEASPAKKKKQGRPADTDPRADQRIHDAWKAGGYRSYEEFARIYGVTSQEVEGAVDRHRKRRNKPPD